MPKWREEQGEETWEETEPPSRSGVGVEGDAAIFFQELGGATLHCFD
jgi:hypothetical protein